MAGTLIWIVCIVSRYGINMGLNTVFNYLLRILFVQNTPPYVYAPILDSHDFFNGSYTKHLEEVARDTTNKQTRAQAKRIQFYDEDFRRRTGNNYTYYDQVYKGTLPYFNIQNMI